MRAAGFRDHTFEQLVGRDRYVWLRRLGNRNIETRTGPRIQIAEPEGAYDLLDLALGVAPNRRLLFFCACERPINDDGEACHRVTVAKLVREAAMDRGVATQTVEWPGGAPETLEVEVTPAILRAVRRGRTSVPLPDPIRLDRFGGLAWGSPVHLRAGDDDVAVVTGPSGFQSGRWFLPVLRVFEGREASMLSLMKWGAQFRRKHGYDAESVLPSAG